MLKSYVDKIKTKLCAWKYGCECCMDKKDKPRIRRQKRRVMKGALKKDIKTKIHSDYGG